MRKYFLAGCVSLLLLISCRHISSDQRKYALLNESLEKSLQLTNRDNYLMLARAEENLLDPRYSDRLKNWYPRLQTIKKNIDSTCTFINLLKNEIKNSSKSSLSKFNYEQLYQRVITSQYVLLSAKANIYNLFDPSFEHLLLKNNPTNFVNLLYYSDSKSESIAMLNYIKHNLFIAEKKLLEFGVGQCYPGCMLTFQSYTPILFYKSTVVNPGDEVQITAGVGSFSKNAIPEVEINGEKKTLNDAGYCQLSFKAPLKAGQYSVPVKISYIDQDGFKNFIEKSTTYTVMEAGKQK